MSYERSKDVEFLEPYITSSYGFLIGKQAGTPPFFDFTKAFHLLLWVTAIMTLFVFLIAITIVAAHTNFHSNATTFQAVIRSVFNVIALTLRQGMLMIMYY